MEQFYNQAKAMSSEAVKSKWEKCVLDAAKEGKSLFDVRCEFLFQPDAAAIKALETEQVKLCVDHVPAWTYDPDGNTPQLSYTQPQYYPEKWTVQVWRPRK